MHLVTKPDTAREPRTVFTQRQQKEEKAANTIDRLYDGSQRGVNVLTAFVIRVKAKPAGPAARQRSRATAKSRCDVNRALTPPHSSTQVA
jgi:hypothetical protein